MGRKAQGTRSVRAWGVTVPALFLLAMLVVVAPVAGAAYPERDITMVVQAAPGGASDYVARTMAQYAAPILGVRINVINRTGGAGAVGMGFLANSRPDGYTVGYVPVELSMLKHLGYADIYPGRFDLILRANVLPAALTVRADSPYRSVEDFIRAAKARPGALSVGNAGPGSIWHLAAAALEDAAGVQLKHLPFDGAAPAVAALLGGNLDAVTVSPSEVLPHVQAGRLRILAVMSESRSQVVPDVPTFRELGYDLVIMAWGGFALPKGVPRPVLETLHAAFKQAYDNPGFQKAFLDRGIEPGYMDPAAFTAFANRQYELFGRLFSRLGLAK
ncbi:tripartite tricarboxylate transporter substrate binding protein [Carboxydochorda subterranea]|uniref:Tripartite tricarboxylate transporter substrate binding protein n=1 Tax=Carboxydichorda subterranea TaxID=3109565 RepID=A0ABZ1BXD4_9FIRM|nr:tripartite tricarboxylate transporter substrate binding protein [Limnochorda sp. L945t]WRP17280.1 tripartite tricarboxylate transporter substrate binding protein [Limnochorda sp. L945t]